MDNYLQQNILVDDSGKALLCDFGLSRVKADIMSRTVMTDAVAVAGSRYWMAPERLMGKPLRKPCDIYSFGITAHEVI
jgi:serine/threonine protein kinase